MIKIIDNRKVPKQVQFSDIEQGSAFLECNDHLALKVSSTQWYSFHDNRLVEVNEVRMPFTVVNAEIIVTESEKAMANIELVTKMSEKAMAYKPTCPRGYTDCVYDPAYIKYHDPEWYEELYGNKTLEEAADDCRRKVAADPDGKYYCYDDEDK